MFFDVLYFNKKQTDSRRRDEQRLQGVKNNRRVNPKPKHRTLSSLPVVSDFPVTLRWWSHQLMRLSALPSPRGGRVRSETLRREERTPWWTGRRWQGSKPGVHSDSVQSSDWPADAPETPEPMGEPPGATEAPLAPPLGQRPHPPWKRWTPPW